MICIVTVIELMIETVIIPVIIRPINFKTNLNEANNESTS